MHWSKTTKYFLQTPTLLLLSATAYSHCTSSNPRITILNLTPLSNMSGEASDSDPISRQVGGTEHSWCKAVPTGTGITVLALLLSKPPNLPLLQSTLHSLQISHPILRSQLHFDPSTNTFSFSFTLPSSPPHLQIRSCDLPPSTSPMDFHAIIEHEMNINPWINPDPPSDLFFASVYTLANGQWVVVLRVHTAACDRAAAAWLLRELLGLVGSGGAGMESGKEGEVLLGIEEYVPSGKGNKPFWARGVDMLGYSVNSFRLANLEFKDAQSPRSSEFVRFKINSEDTDRIISGCKSRGIKLCGLLSAAALIAARSSKSILDDQWEKYSVATLVDCRSILDPVLSCHDVGFFHSAIINSHDIKGGENVWELAKRTYGSYENAKNNNKHFTDMGDLNFLMCRAIENPGLTPSGSLRTSVVSVFEDPVIDNVNEFHQEIGLEDYVGCASIHGVGPSIAIFDTIRDGELDCSCVYPSPLHSREQMQEIVDNMKKILLDGCNL